MAATLAAEIKATAKAVAEAMPEGALDVFYEAKDNVEKEFDAKATIQPGEKLPDFILSDARGKPVSSIDLLAKGPLLILFYRGGWCPYCNLTLRAFQQRLPDFQARGVTMVAITPEQPDTSLTTSEKNELAFPVLTDDGLQLARKLHIIWKQPKDVVDAMHKLGADLEKRHGNDSPDMVLPATLLVDEKGVVRNIFVKGDWMQRLEPQEAVNWVNAL